MSSKTIRVSSEVWDEIAKRGKFGESEDTVLRRVFGISEESEKSSSSGGQSKKSGARANAWGRETADKIAKTLGAKKINPNANEYKLNDQAVTIRCARSTTNTVGVTYKMLDRISSVIAALENDAGQFDLYAITPEMYSKEMRATRSKGPSSGRVGMVRTVYFRNHGDFIRTITLK